MADWIKSAINGASSALGSYITAKYNAAEAEKQRDWNDEMMQKQNDWTLQMWNRTNDYNSPVEQIKRLKDAGLNPLNYGLDGSSANNVQSAQALGYDRASLSGIENPVSAGLSARVQSAQAENIEADTEKKKSETRSIDAKLPFEVDSLKSQIRASNLSSDAQETVNKYIDRQLEAEIRVKNSTAAEADSMVQKAAAEIQKMDYEKTTMYISWLETHEKILNLQKNRDLTDKQIEELDSLISKNMAEAEKIGLDVSNYDDITVIGTASHNIKLGPFSVQEGEPITLAMKKAAEKHAEDLKEKQNRKRVPEANESFSSIRKNSPYNGPIYD